MKKLLCVILLIVMAGSVQMVQAQMEPVYFHTFHYQDAKDRALAKMRRQLEYTGFGYEYQADSNLLQLHIYEPDYFPGLFRKRRDGLRLHWNGDTFYLGRNAIREHFSLLYQQKSALAFGMEYSRLLSKYVPVDKFPLLEDGSDLYHYMSYKALNDSISEREQQRLQAQMHKLYQQQKKMDRQFRKFLRGKAKAPAVIKNDASQWAIQFSVPGNFDPDFDFEFTHRKQSLARVTFDSLMGQPADFLEQQEMAECYPFDRYTYFKKLRGLGLSRLYFQPFRAPNYQTSFRTFYIPFEQNSSTPLDSDEKLQKIVKLMQDSSYVIRKARAYAYASVEGVETINHRLQRERLEVIMEVLRQNNRDSIEMVELETAENWEMWEDQIADSSYLAWQGLSRSEIKTLLTRPDSLAAMEKILSKQRYARLDLQMHQQMDWELQVIYAMRDQKELWRRLGRTPENRHNEGQRKELLAKLLGRQIFIDSVARAQHTTFDNMLEKIWEKDAVLMNFDYLMWKESKGIPVVNDSIVKVLAKAWLACIKGLEESRYSHRKDYWQRKMVDIQNYAFENVTNGKLTPEALCFLQWTDQPHFYPLMLNEMDFMEDKDEDFIADMTCYQLDTSLVDDNNEYDFAWDRENPDAVAFGKPARVRLPHTSYYTLLKKQVLYNDKEINEWVVRSDEILEFDLYEFLHYNVLNWDTWNGIYYDDAVGYKVMLKQMQRLVNITEILCPTQVYQLFLDLHLRVSYLVKHDPAQQKEALASLGKLQKYFMDNLAWLSEEDAQKLTRHLVWMGKYYHKNETYELAVELIGRMKQLGIAHCW